MTFAMFLRHQSKKSLLTITTLLFAASCFAQSNVRLEEPMEDFRVPQFNDEGYREWHLKATRGTYQNDNEVLIEGMSIRQFTGDETNEVVGTLETPKATYMIDSALIVGAGEILAKSDSFELTGSDWVYQANENRLTINKNAKVIIFAEIGDILK